MQFYRENERWLSGTEAGGNLSSLGYGIGMVAHIELDELVKCQDLAGQVANYQKETVPDLLRLRATGTPWNPNIVDKAMAKLSDINFGLTDEEYANIVGSGQDEMTRYERLGKFARWVVSDGTFLAHTPGELLREGRYGWLGLSLEHAQGQYLDLLASGEEADFKQLKRELEEVLDVNGPGGSGSFSD
jgi:hypothetical protein